MKRHLLYLCLLLSAHTAFAATPADTTGTWIDQLRILRDAIYHRDKATTKTFFTFPFKDDQFWAFTATNLYDKKSPVTEQLFDRYFDKIFPKQFIDAFLKIKTKQLYETGEDQTRLQTDDQKESYLLTANYDKTEQTVSLSYIVNIKDKEEPIEYAITYIFKIVKGKLKFDHSFMAG
ncbi:hypothetical protein [Chitinophaga sp.]|uniref:hypothetical protein n=1 Tax=Chitinophaga sp. TaxID=1869181 RepID=UPI0031D65FCC